MQNIMWVRKLYVKVVNRYTRAAAYYDCQCSAWVCALVYYFNSLYIIINDFMHIRFHHYFHVQERL